MRLITLFLLCVFSFAVTLVWLYIWWHAALSPNWQWGVDFNRYYEAVPEGVIFHAALALPVIVMWRVFQMVGHGYFWTDRLFKTGYRNVRGDADLDEGK